MPKTHKDLLEEIRENFSYYQDAWRDIREEARTDMRYIAGDPWDPEERKFREDNNRPVMSWDELSPYINQLINNPRQNKRGIKINPKGNGANEKTAELRENKIREICYNSKAQAAFTTGFQGAAERSYGFWRVGKRFLTTGVSGDLGPDAFNQELYVGRIPNPDTVLIDPTYKEVDTSDKMGCFVTDTVRKVDFETRWSDAEITDFTPEHMELAPQWIHDKEITVAEYWKVELEKKRLHLIEAKGGPIVLYHDELPTGFDMKRIKRSRDIEKRVVTQYITNGIEILDEQEIEIPWIPIVAVFGKEIWVDEGGGAKRQLISLVRLARDPYMAYCFYRSQEAEEAGLTPKAPYIVYKGQINAADKDIWATVGKIPYGYLEVEATTDATGENILEKPTRQAFQPNFQAYEVACEAARRAIQTAMGGSNLPTAAQRKNEKSGVALQEIEDQEDRGTFHFIDNYNFALEFTGTILDAWAPFVYDTARDEAIRKADETTKSIRINDPENTEQGPDGHPVKAHYDMTTGDHGVTVSVSPNFNSQRDEASAFVDTLIASIEGMAQVLPPGALAKLLSLSIKLKNIGPLGDEMADVLSPPSDQQVMQQQMQQGQAQLAQSQQIIAELQTELQKLKLEKAGKVIDNEYAIQLAKINNDVKVLIANTNTMQQNLSERLQMFAEYWKETHGAAHDVALQAQQHAHEKDQAAVALASQTPEQPDQP